MFTQNCFNHQKMDTGKCLRLLASQPLVVSKHSPNSDSTRAELFSGDMAVVYLKTKELGHSVETVIFSFKEQQVMNWLAFCFFDNAPHEWENRDNRSPPVPVESLERQIDACRLMMAVKQALEKPDICEGCGLCSL